jgi:hypothetical protein
VQVRGLLRAYFFFLMMRHAMRPRAARVSQRGSLPTAASTIQPTEAARLVVARSHARESSPVRRVPKDGVSSTGGGATAWSGGGTDDDGEGREGDEALGLGLLSLEAFDSGADAGELFAEFEDLFEGGVLAEVEEVEHLAFDALLVADLGVEVGEAVGHVVAAGLLAREFA